MSTNHSNPKAQGFTPEEKEAMRARTKELKAEARASKKKADGEKDVLAVISDMKEPDKSMAEKIHQLVMQVAPELWPKTWYGMPAYSIQGKKVVCFFQSGQKFGTRYATFGFQQDANLDDGSMWPVAFALTKISKPEVEMIKKLVKQAIS